MRHQVGVDPVDDAGINVSCLEERGDLGVFGTAIDPDHVLRPPVLPVFNDHGDGRIKNAGIENKKKPSARKPPRR